MTETKKPTITVYMSHSIRGIKGSQASKEDMETNCEKAIKAANVLRQHFSQLDIYVPAEHDEFVSIAYHHNWITEKQLLEVDCLILEKRDYLFVYCPDRHISRGMGREIEHAQYNKIPVIYLPNLGKEILSQLEQILK